MSASGVMRTLKIRGCPLTTQSGRESFVYATIVFLEPSNGDEMAQSGVALPSDDGADCDIAQARDRTSVCRREKNYSGRRNRADRPLARARGGVGRGTARLVRGAY